MNPLRDVLFLPLDIPPIPNKEEILAQFTGDDHYVWWKQETLLGADASRPLGSAAEIWTEAARYKYPELIAHIEKYLPFREFSYVRLARAKGEVPPHVDENYTVAPFAHHRTATQQLVDHQQFLEPVGYRFVISGSRDSLYLCDRYDETYKQRLTVRKRFCTVPMMTDFFLIHNSKVPHGVSPRLVVDDDRLVGFVLGFLDRNGHVELMKRSLERFRPFGILREEFEREATLHTL